MSPRLGIVGVTPGSFRKSDKQRGCRIRNLEVHTENGSGFVGSLCDKATRIGAAILKELEGPRGGRAWLTRAGENLADLTKPL